MGPINLILHCPSCGTQHVDMPCGQWTNPPHKSHLCYDCGLVWRPADVCTNGVLGIQSRGKSDSVLPVTLWFRGTVARK